jgi:hypothetical protein
MFPFEGRKLPPPRHKPRGPSLPKPKPIKHVATSDAPKKTCGKCWTRVHRDSTVCTSCGKPFPTPVPENQTEASTS